MNAISEEELPTELSLRAAVGAAYPNEISLTIESLKRGLSVLVECDKALIAFFYSVIRDRLKKDGIRCVYADGRSVPEPGQLPMSMTATMMGQIREAVRGGTRSEGDERRIIVLPHLDLLTTSNGGITTEAREAIALLYEDPNVLWMGFRDTSFILPKTVSNVFQHHISILGTSRDRLCHLVTQRDSRKLGRDGLNVYKLYKHVSGLNVIRLRQLLSSLEGEDYPEDDTAAWKQIRMSTLDGEMSVPEISLEKDIGGYAPVKKKIREDILDIIKRKESLTDSDKIAAMESLIPKGMIFWGPPGTGKTLFAKAIASALGAAVQVVNGPELKSRWVGESEENLRRIFTQARQSAPSLIVFDEMDSFAGQRGTYTGSGVEHSMVNQLLTEMDGFRSNEMVFIVGTTNFVESLDSALLRPGRFEFHLHIPYPDHEDREAVVNIYNKRLGLNINDEAMAYIIKQTRFPITSGSGHASMWSGDHLQGLCRSIARQRLRDGKDGATSVADVERAINANVDLPKFTPEEELVIATHECGHAIVAMHTKNSPPIDKISILGDLPGSLGFVQYTDPAHKYVVTQGQLIDAIATLYGGRAAEKILIGDLSVGSAHDIEQATKIANVLIKNFGYSSNISVRHYEDVSLSDYIKSLTDHEVDLLLNQERERAESIVEEHRDELIALRDILLIEKSLDAKQIKTYSK